MTTPRRRSIITLCLISVSAALLLSALLPTGASSTDPGPGFGAGPVTAATPLSERWAGSADLVPGIDPSSSNVCQSAASECLAIVVEEMQARIDRLGCRHTAPFAFTYLETTRVVESRVSDPGFFLAPATITQLDALFAKLYFDAFDNWHAGRHDEVPGAWQLAFRAADEGRTSAAADVFLGMNAHISRDLAYAVAQVVGAGTGMLDDRGDYDRVNDVLAEVQGPMLVGAAERYDPRLAELPSLIPSDTELSPVDLIAEWRDRSFELGHRLALAKTPEERDAVAAEIERTAVAGAVMILNSDASLRAPDDSFDRDAYCNTRQ